MQIKNYGIRTATELFNKVKRFGSGKGVEKKIRDENVFKSLRRTFYFKSCCLICDGAKYPIGNLTRRDKMCAVSGLPKNKFSFFFFFGNVKTS